jgi:hypothetical protein
MPATEAQLRSIANYTAKNLVYERARKLAYYHANKETIKVKRKEVRMRQKAAADIIKAERKKKEEEQKKMVTDILTRHRQAIHDELLQTYTTQGMPVWIVDAICVDMNQLYGLGDPRPLGENPRLAPEDPVIVSPSPIPDSV